MADMRTVEDGVAPRQEDFVEVVCRLSDDQLGMPSSCAGWSVRDVVIHVAWHIHLPPSAYVKDVVQFGAFGGARFESKLLERERVRTNGELVDWLAAPAQMNANNLGELIVHQQDVRRSVGAPRAIAPDRLTWALDYCLTRKGGGYFGVGGGSYKRTRGVRLVATDTGWAGGTGPEVRGPAEAI